MGLYDENEETGAEEEQDNAEEIGKSVVKSTRKGKKRPVNAITEGFDWSILARVSIYVLIVLFVGVIIYAGYLTLQPNMISYAIKPNPVYTGVETVSQLNVEIKNVEKETLKNIQLSIVPIDNLSVAVIPSDPIAIPILGAGESRTFQFNIGGIGNIAEGEYAIKIIAKTPAKIYSKDLVWKVKKAV